MVRVFIPPTIREYKLNISFYPGSENVYKNVPSPMASKLIIPQWYKNIKPTNNLNVKNCIPYLDTLSSGYIQLTWEDLYVTNKDGKLNVYINSETNVPLFNVREKSDITIGENFYKTEFVWHRHWAVKLPEGYSALVTHPLNRYDLPFVTLSGIVDFDQYHHTKTGNLPFYIYKDFQGIIPKGTPMFQIIPFKRESWKSTKEIYNEQDWKEKETKRFSIRKDAYKKMFWQKKDFD